MFKHNNMRSDGVLIFLFILLAVSAAGLLANYSASITGALTSATTTSSAVIQKYFSINISANLSDGIDFGSIESLPAVNHNASLNWNDTNYPTENDGNETLYYMTVETDSNTPVDLCIRATELNTSGGLEIGIGNYTFADNQTNNITWPGAVDQYTMSTTAYVAADTNVPVGDSSYFRFWLDVPATTASGTYNNTVTFLGRPTGVACP
jgi:hypothetical protein